MHVLFLPKWYPGEADPQLGDFLRKQAIAASGRVQVSVLAVLALPQTGARTRQEVHDADGPWELRSYYRTSTLPMAALRKAVNLVRYGRAMWRGWRRVVRERGMPQLVHVHILVRPAVFAWWLHQVHGLPYILSEQSSEYLDGTWQRKGPFFKAVNRFLFRRAAAVTAVSALLGERLVHLGLCQRFTVVPNVVPGLDRPLPPPAPPGSFLVVADLVDRTKNVSGVLRALASARAERPDLRLTVIGDGPDRSKLETLASELGLNGHVRFLGRLPNAAVLDHLAQAAAVIVNSRVETFSVVTGEALGAGRPVIATRCGGPVAFITPENGLLIPVNDEGALREAMLHLARHAGRYDPVRLRAGVSGRFSAKAVGRAFEVVYRRVLGEQP